MKNFWLGLAAALILGAIINGALGRLHCGSFCEKQANPTDPAKATKSVICDLGTGTCENYLRSGSGGNLKISVTASGKPVRRLLISLFPGDHPQQSGSIYAKYTDTSGVSLFDDIPEGTYTIFVNPNNYPLGYQLSEVNPIVKVIKKQTAEKIIKMTTGAPQSQGDSDEGEKLLDCQRLLPNVKEFGSLKVQITGDGMPLQNLEVDLASKPGDDRCMRKTGTNGAVYFDKVPAGKWAIFFNQADFPKKYGSPVENIQITQGQTVEKKIEYRSK